MTDKKFDGLLRDKLDKFEATKPDNAWDLFKEELDYAQSKDAIFDQQLKSKVDTYTDSDAIASWDAFQEKFKQNEIEESNAFDENIKNSIEAFEAPMAENSWNQFLDYFHNYTKLRRKLYISKAIEACLILLAIFTFWNMQPQIKKGIEKIDLVFNRFHHHSIEEQERNQGLTNKEVTQELIAATDKVDSNARENANTKSSTNLNADAKSNSNGNVDAIESNESENVEPIESVSINPLSASNSDLVNPNWEVNDPITESTNINIEAATLESNANQRIPFLDSENPSENNRGKGEEILPLKTLIPPLAPLQKETNKSFTQIDKVQPYVDQNELNVGNFADKSGRSNNAFASIDGMPLKALNYPRILPVANISPLKLKHKTNLYLSTQASMDVNYVYTPFDKVYNTNPYLQAAVGYSAGLNIAFEKGRWAVETGAHYSTKTYSPIDIEEVVGSFNQGFYGVSLKDIEIETINIPVMARYKLVHLRNWKIFGMLGGSVNMAILANYFKKNTNYNAVTSTASLVPLRNANIEDKNFSDGLFEGGDLFENIYFTANAAINIERKITNRLSIYVQPGIQYNLLNKGLGPNNDRVHTASLALGTRVQLR